MKDVTEIVSDSFCPNAYQLSEVDLTRNASNNPDKKGQRVKTELGLLINYFLEKSNKKKAAIR